MYVEGDALAGCWIVQWFNTADVGLRDQGSNPGTSSLGPWARPLRPPAYLVMWVGDY